VNIRGQRLKRTIPVCGPGAFVVLKALAFHHRLESKDAFDLVYVVQRFPGGAAAVAERLVEHVSREPGTVREALAALADDFSSVDSIGPQQAAEFGIAAVGDQDAAAADALGYVDDLLRECRDQGLS